MKDHMSAGARAAIGRPTVYVDFPDWTIELLLCLVLALGAALVVTWAKFYEATRPSTELADARAEAVFWREMALAPETATSVRLEPLGAGYKCKHFNIRAEWELAVAAECEVLSSLLQMARSTP